MAGYLRRLAQHSGLIAAARPRAEPGAETPDITEIHEERVIGGAQPAAPPGGDRSASVHDRPAPAAGADTPPAPDAAPTSGGPGPASASGASAPSSAARASSAPLPERKRLQAPPSAHTPDSPAARAPSVSGIERASVERVATRSVAAPALSKSERAAPSADVERAATVPAVAAADASRPGPRLDAPAQSSSPIAPIARGSAAARSTPARTEAAPHGEREVRPSGAVASGARAGAAPRRATIAEPAPRPRAEAQAPHAKDNSVKVHIGKINVEIRVPAPRPAAPFVAAPAPAPVFAAPAPAEAPFSSYRHYLRSGS